MSCCGNAVDVCNGQKRNNFLKNKQQGKIQDGVRSVNEKDPRKGSATRSMDALNTKRNVPLGESSGILQVRAYVDNACTARKRNGGTTLARNAESRNTRKNSQKWKQS